MKRRGGLFPLVCSWDNLERAARLCRKRKRYRIYAENFELKRETILACLRGELLSGAWRPAGYRTFRIFDPKERVICAPPYRDRIVHHALCAVIGPILEGGMVFHTYSCRKEKGTSAARKDCRRAAARFRYALKLDAEKYFASIDHLLLKEKLRRKIKCRRTLALLDRIIDSWSDPGVPTRWFPGDDLLAPLDRPRGLPIGSLTSQLFANLYLSRIDHLIEEKFRPGAYLRYTDDLVLFSDSKKYLRKVKEELAGEFGRERLSLHRTKCRIFPCREGVPFLGFRFFPDRVRVLRSNRLRFEQRMARFRRERCRGGFDAEKVGQSVFGWFQFVREFPANEGLVRAQCVRQVF